MSLFSVRDDARWIRNVIDFRVNHDLSAKTSIVAQSKTNKIYMGNTSELKPRVRTSAVEAFYICSIIYSFGY
jgi:hypothetical protein